MPLPAIIGIASQLATFAPVVARWLDAGESGRRVAEQVAGVAKYVTGATSPEDAILRLREDAELQHRFRMEVVERESELERAYLQDRADARERDVRMREAGYRNVRADILAVVAVVGLVGLTWMMLYVTVPAGPGRDVLMMLSGALITIVKDVYAFEFGSSRGSKDKDQVIGGRRG